MRCQSCGHNNRATAAFCEDCGTKLAQACPSCGSELRTGARFCDACGLRLTEGAAPAASPTTHPARTADPRAYTPPHLAQKILRDRAVLEGERRIVTVLSADAVGSTPMGEHLDEEALYTIMQGCFSRMMDAVHRYEGTIAQFLGDGFLALFGAPIAHEDSSRRAVAAALEMQRAIAEYAVGIQQLHGVVVTFRIGLNTGPVVVGRIGDDLSMDYTAIGDTANLAARMQQLAEPGQVYLSEQAHRAVRDYVECEPLGPRSVKGKVEPVAAYRALGEKGQRTRLDVATARGLTPLIGRRHELRVLGSYFERVLQGQGQVVFISGEAGIGKSRLLLEFRRGLEQDQFTWLEGHSISFGKNIAYLPLIDILKQTFAIQEGDDDATIIGRVEQATGGWEQAARATVPYLKYLLNVDPGDPSVVVMDPMVRRAGIFDAFRALLQQESRRQPLVVVMEDLHWIDEMSEEALAAVVDAVAAASVLLIATYRPGYAPSLGERSTASRLHLTELRPEQSAALVEAMLQATKLPPALQQLIASKAEGNPFYIEEVTTVLVESGVLHRSNGDYTLTRPAEQVHIPNTVQEVILSRIDRLERDARDALQLASVIGREFTGQLLARISDGQTSLDASLQELKVLELIFQKAYFPELAYMFKHALTHDVAYSTLLLERRKALHRVVAAAVEELYADRLSEQYETLAYHYTQGEEWVKALEYLEKAGDKATAAYANQDALDFYARALEICTKLGDGALATSATLAQKRGLVNFGIGDVPAALRNFEGILNTARVLRDPHLEGLALVFRGMAESFAHDFEASEATLRAALAIADEEGFDDIRFSASHWLSHTLTAINHHAEARPVLREVEALAPVIDDSHTRAFMSFLGGLIRIWPGRYDEALAIVERWQSAVDASHHMIAIVGNRWVEALACAGKGEYTRALTILQEVISTSERVGEQSARMRSMNTLGWVYSELQDHDRALEWNIRSARAVSEHNAPDPEVESNARVNLGDALLALGRIDEAEEHFRWVEHLVRRPRPEDRCMLWRYAQHLFHSYGELWLLRGDLEQALAYADECLQLAEATESRKNIVKARRLRAQVFLVQDKLVDAEPEVELALQVAREIGNPPQLWKTLVTLGELRQARGRPVDAQQAYRDALAILEAVAASLTDTPLRDTFLGSPHVQHIRHLAGT